MHSSKLHADYAYQVNGVNMVDFGPQPSFFIYLASKICQQGDFFWQQ